MSSDNTDRSSKDVETLVEAGGPPEDSGSSGLTSRIRRGVAELIGVEDTDPDPKAFNRSGSTMYSASADVTRPERQIEDFWEEYQQNPIISSQIQNLALEVFEPGYWVTADNEKTVEEIEEFLDNMGIRATQTHVPFSEFGKFILIQHQVRGTFLGEKVTDDKGRHVAINAINPSTIEVYTKPGSNVILPPDYKDDPGKNATIKQTADGKTAAYVQFDNQFGRWTDRRERKFTRDQILHWARNPDIGDSFGNSRIEPVYERSRALREKLQDNDLSIAMKAWPMVIFQLGDPDRPWSDEQQRDFMKAYDEANLGPGMYHGVPGDVEPKEFAGETADIESHVNTDVDMIVSAMPGPKHTLGSFADGAQNQALSGAYERQFRKTVRSLRRDLEKLFTPYLKEVAESWGYDSSGLELHIGRPDGEVAPEDVQGSIIRYTSDANGHDDPQPGDRVDGQTVIDEEDPISSQEHREQQEQEQEQNTDTNGSGSGSGSTGPSVPGRADERASAGTPAQPYSVSELAKPDSVTIADIPSDSYVEELEDPRRVSTSDLEMDVRDAVAEILINARDTTIDIIDARYGGGQQPNPLSVSSEFETQVSRHVRNSDIDQQLGDVATETSKRTMNTLEQHSHYPHITANVRSEHLSVRDRAVERMLFDTQSLGTEMAKEMGEAIRQFCSSDDQVQNTVDRIMETYDESTIRNRSRLLGRMRIQELINELKLDEYKRHDDVVGVKLLSSCSESSHRFTSDLAGCDGTEPAVAMFDSDESIGSQFESQATHNAPASFRPLPDTPPFHFGDRSELGPVYADDY